MVEQYEPRFGIDRSDPQIRYGYRYRRTKR